ncbi:MAG: DUF4380 domain-containing protein [Bacteroidales bacterium]
MKYLFTFFIICLISISNRAQNNADKTINEKSKIVLNIPNSELIIDQGFGARIISLKYKNKEILAGSEIHAENFGSTLWTDPQSAWGWPPYETLDAKPYQLNIKNKEYCFTSKPDEKSGFQLSKNFTVSEKDSCFIINYQIKNISKTNQSVGAWEVTRVLPGGMSLFPSAPDSSIMASSNLPGVSLKNGIIWFIYDFDKIKSHAKLFAMGSQGWFAHVIDNMVFIKTFEDIPTSEIAKEQGEIEIYVNGDQLYTELENHGKHENLKPGQLLNYQVKWYMRTIPSNINKSEGSTDLVHFIQKQIHK